MSRVSALDKAQFSTDAVYQLFTDLLNERAGVRSRLGAKDKDSVSAMARLLFRKKGHDCWGLAKANNGFIFYKDLLNQIVAELDVTVMDCSWDAGGNSIAKHLVAYDGTADVKWWVFKSPVAGSMGDISRSKGFLSWEKGIGTYTLKNGNKITLENSGTIYNVKIYAGSAESDFICSVIRENGEIKEVHYLQ
jgi:hypothetical protein